MSYAIVFSSKTGNTALLAQTLQEQLPQADCCYFGAPDPVCGFLDGQGQGRC